MSEVKHTPGLTVELSASTGLGYASVRECDGDLVRTDRIVADVYGTGTDPTDSDSLATLFAASPALLEACKAAVPILMVAQAEANKRLDNALAERCAATIDYLSSAIARAEKGA